MINESVQGPQNGPHHYNGGVYFTMPVRRDSGHSSASSRSQISSDEELLGRKPTSKGTKKSFFRVHCLKIFILAFIVVSGASAAAVFFTNKNRKDTAKPILSPDIEQKSQNSLPIQPPEVHGQEPRDDGALEKVIEDQSQAIQGNLLPIQPSEVYGQEPIDDRALEKVVEDQAQAIQAPTGLKNRVFRFLQKNKKKFIGVAGLAVAAGYLLSQRRPSFVESVEVPKALPSPVPTPKPLPVLPQPVPLPGADDTTLSPKGNRAGVVLGTVGVGASVVAGASLLRQSKKVDYTSKKPLQLPKFDGGVGSPHVDRDDEIDNEVARQTAGNADRQTKSQGMQSDAWQSMDQYEQQETVLGKFNDEYETTLQSLDFAQLRERVTSNREFWKEMETDDWQSIDQVEQQPGPEIEHDSEWLNEPVTLPTLQNAQILASQTSDACGVSCEREELGSSPSRTVEEGDAHSQLFAKKETPSEEETPSEQWKKETPSEEDDIVSAFEDIDLD
jgi:hypothetical protein